MTTYTYTGVFLKWDKVTDDLLAVTPTTLSIVAADSNDSFSYVHLPLTPDDDDPIINTTSPDPYNMWLNGAAVDDSYDFSMLQVTWGSGNLAYVMAAFTESVSSYDDFIFFMGGTPLPSFSSVAEFDAFDAGLTSVAGITSGAFAPGTDIAFDSLFGTVVTEHDTILGDDTGNVFYGGIGRDKIRGEGGNDRLFGGDGNDKLWGGDNADRLLGGKGADALTGNKGRDELKGGGGNDKLFGGSGSDNLFGNDGRDILYGGGQLDDLEGGKGADTLSGGKGDDNLRGGAGADVFLYSGARNEGDDVIHDFKLGVDKIHIGGTVTYDDITIEGDEFVTVLSWKSTSVALSGVDSSLIVAEIFDFI